MRRALSLVLGLVSCFSGQVASEVASSSAAASDGPTTSAPQGTSAGPSGTAANGADTGSGTAGTAGTSGTAGSTGEAGDSEGLPLGEQPPRRFAVIGDFGLDGDEEAQVAGLVAAWNPELVLTVGDNNYYDGLASTIDANIGKHYQRFIGGYTGAFGPGAPENRFFPCPGNHDWNSGDLQGYLDYFTLPGNERYYRVQRGPVEFFLLDSDKHEPDGATVDSVQAQWLEAALADSEATFQVVLMHHAPYSSGLHNGTKSMRWPFAAWGADLVLAGHDHDYERMVVDGLPYLVVGTGGAALRDFETEEVGSQRGHADTFGALRIEATAKSMTLDFVSSAGARIDRLTLAAPPAPPSWQQLVSPTATWRYLEALPGPDWVTLEYAEPWPAGPGPLGFGVGGEGTTLSGGQQFDRPITTYFRHRFHATAEDLGGPLRLRLAVDDGAIIRLNGVEVYRINLSEGTVGDQSHAAAVVGDWFPGRVSETMIPGDALRVGDNVLAVEVHQYSRVSTDLRLELELSAPRF
jgi:tartrate-resistant acid phosphatase type 5